MNKEIIEAAKVCSRGGLACYGCEYRLASEHVRECTGRFAKAITDHHNKYRWHDLRKDPTDLPKTEGHFNVCVWLKPNEFWGIEESYIYDTQYFCERFQTTPMSEVIAWREIEPFEPDTYCPNDYHGGDCY